MKKILFAGVVATTLMFASCIETKEPESTMKTSIPTVALVTSSNGDAPVVVPMRYEYTFDQIKGTVSIGGDMVLSSTETLKVKTNPMKYNVYLTEFDQSKHEVIAASSSDAGTVDNEPITNFNCELISTVYFAPELDGAPAISYPTATFPNGIFAKYTWMNYRIGDSKYVRTFWPDMTFAGETTTSYTDKTGAAQKYTDKGARYRLVMDLKKMTCKVVIYNAKFAEAMPEIKGIVLSDLPIVFDNAGYTVSATNIVPSVIEAGQLVPNQRYTMTEFTFTSTGDLTGGSCQFKIAGGFESSFSGAYMVRPKMNN